MRRVRNLFSSAAKTARAVFTIPLAGGLALIPLALNLSAAELVVAQDGSGQYRTVQSAIDAAPVKATKPCVIHIKPGIYHEKIVVPREKTFLRFVGDHADTTVLTFDLNANSPGADGKPIGTHGTASTVVAGNDFTALNITFENPAGTNGQALAIDVAADCAAFYQCRFVGWQDTILEESGRHYYEQCYIAGSVDFIFGWATAYFDHCHLHCRGNGFITAASTPETNSFGYVFADCRVTSEPVVRWIYLGRPWRPHAHVIFLNAELPAQIKPGGWNNWDNPENEKTARFAEYNSTGPGANAAARVTWSKQLNEAEAKAITVERVLGGRDGWKPARKR